MERQWQSNEPPLAAIEECKTTFDLLHSRISSDPGVPVQDPTTSFWQQTPLFPELVNMKSQNLPESADIVIIGSGITGLSVAYTILTELKAMGMQRQVVMLEARQACSGATGRNGGHIKVAAYEVYSRNKARYGKERAKAIILFQLRHLPTLMNLERAKNLEGADIRKVETVDLFMDVAMFLKSQEMVEELRDDLPELAHDVRIWEGDAARRRFEVGAHVIGAISYHSGSIWAYRFVLSLCSYLLSTHPEFSLETDTPVPETKTIDSSERPFQILTARGEIFTSHIVHATNSHASHLVPGFSGKLFSIRGQVSAQRPGKKFPRLDGSRSWSFVQKKGFDYVVQIQGKHSQNAENGGELVTGGGLFQSSMGMDEFGLTSDDKTDPIIGAYLGGILPTVFGAENWGEDAPRGRMENMWVGTLGYTADMQPMVGKLDQNLTGRSLKSHASSGKEHSGPGPAEWVSAGYNGEGMVHAWLCGVAVGLMVLGRDEIERSNESGIPEGKVEDWLPREFRCSAERVSKANVYTLLALM